jgi:hypothetical protein
MQIKQRAFIHLAPNKKRRTQTPARERVSGRALTVNWELFQPPIYAKVTAAMGISRG